MTVHFLDTSSFLKLLVSEQGSDLMLAWMEEAHHQVKVVSALLPIEARATISRLRKGNRMSPAEATSTLNALAASLPSFFVQPLTTSVLEAAAVLAERHTLRALDALQLASATLARDLMSAPQMRFIASDVELLRAADAEMFTTWNPAA